MSNGKSLSTRIQDATDFARNLHINAKGRGGAPLCDAAAAKMGRLVQNTRTRTPALTPIEVIFPKVNCGQS